MRRELFELTKTKLANRPKQIIDLNQWLFVTINTAKAMIDNTAKSQFAYLNHFIKCDTTREIQYLFDKIQGKFGSLNFSKRYSPKYLYLCSLVANFPPMNLSAENQKLISAFIGFNDYLLYGI
ncbi:hypothetical protein KQI03_07945 [Levilactobacillus brevis]|uniref:hypothetical protein n=1 Tax=Levilactobacillus brevis TaxID=1580 RepID=UPI001C113142|nr:hypothetical protein [Levilactobacillus brevis]MBU5274595.1 hypothetical protein [Levilactobacillus brevis]